MNPELIIKSVKVAKTVVTLLGWTAITITLLNEVK